MFKRTFDPNRCKTCPVRTDDTCGQEDMKISEIERCPLHDPDVVEELNNPEYQKYIDSLSNTN